MSVENCLKKYNFTRKGFNKMFQLKNEELLNTQKNKSHYFITVAGNVGAGKSTLTRMVGEKLGFDTHYEKVDGNPYLGDFYNDQKKWGFHLQLYFLSQRFKQQEEIYKNGRNNIQDRSIYEDVEIFAKNLNENKLMNDRDFDTYKDLFYDLTKHLQKPDLMIYLTGSIDKVLERINHRGRDVEKSVDIEYWKALHNRYENWIPNYNLSPVLYVNIDKIDIVENPEHLDLLCDEIKKILNI